MNLVIAVLKRSFLTVILIVEQLGYTVISPCSK
jgi:hypothetical protein